MHSCNDCKDTGVIHLLTSTVPCSCRTDPATTKCASLERDRQPDPACFGTIKGVTLNACSAPVEGPVTYTLDIEEGTARGRRFTGLSKEAVDFVHAALKAGWDANRVAEHLDEMATFRKVNDAAAVRDAETRALNGFTVDEIQEAANVIQAALLKAGPNITEDGEEQEIIARELTRILVRKTIREAIMGFARTAKPFARGGLIPNANINRLSFVPEHTFGVAPKTPPKGCEFLPYERKGHDPEIRVVPADLLRTPGGKAAMFKAMYGGRVTEADFSQVEARVMAHFERKASDRFNNMQNFAGFPNIPGQPSDPRDPHTGKTWKETRDGQ